MKNKKIKVLEVISSLGVAGGAETFAVNFSKAIHSKVDLTVVILYRENLSDYINDLSKAGIKTIILNKKKHFDVRTIKQLRTIIKRDNIEYIHTENNALITTFFAVLFLKKKPRVYHTIHNPAKIESGGKISQLLYKYFFRQKHIVPVAISKLMSDSANKFYRLQNTPYIYNGIDLSPFDGSKTLGERTYDCAVVARFEKQKNHSFLVDVFAHLHNLLPNLKTIMIGGGSLFKETTDKIEKIGAKSYISTPGVVKGSNLTLNETKILVLGSFYEGNPLCILEAMAAGAIIVSTRVGGIPDIVINGENGFLFDVGDSKSFIQMLYSILSEPTKYDGMRLANIETSKKYSMDKIVDEYIELFQSNWKRK